MNNTTFDFECTPSGSLLSQPSDQRLPYISYLVAMPESVHNLVASARTGAFLQGLSKTNNIPIEKTPQIAFIILRIAVGEKNLAQLGSILSTELQIPNDKAQAMAKEIEKELFAPIALELNQYLSQKRQSAPKPLGGARNVLDLKNNAPPPPPPPIPKKY